MKEAAKPILIMVALFFLSSISAAQQYEPSIGQEGKDVIWVPTPEDLVGAMLDAAKVTSNDYVVDLGSGDGRIVIAAAKRGARAVGIEFNPDMVELSRRNAENAGVAEKTTFVNADLFTVDLSKATVITMYLLSDLNMKLRPAILNLKPGTRVVSHAFTMEDWKWDQSVTKAGRTAYLWIVPAKVEGTWAWPSHGGTTELKLIQTFQKVTGTLRAAGQDLPIQRPRLVGSRISFVAGQLEFSGQVNGKVIEGTVKVNRQDQKWLAVKKGIITNIP